MSRRTRFGILTVQNEPYEVLAQRWQRAENLGFDSLWVADHFVNPYGPREPWFEGWTMLAALAARTQRARIGTLVTSITFRNPAVLAREAMTVDHISNGRLELGIGAGGADLDHSMTGVFPWDRRERVERFGEFVEIVDRALSGEVLTYAGRHYGTRGTEIHPAPVQRPRPPLVLAAHGPKSLRVAARYADTWNSLGGRLSSKEALDLTRRRCAELDEHCVAAGRDPHAVARSFLVGFTDDAPFASPQAFRDFVGRYGEVGINEFIFYWLPKETVLAADRKAIGDDTELERYATEIIASIRSEEARVTGGADQRAFTIPDT